MEEYAPRILNGMTPAQARARLMQQIQIMKDDLAEMQELCVEISPHVAWVVNNKLRLVEKGINGTEAGIRLYFEQGEVYG
jgi:hypothetical protein